MLRGRIPQKRFSGDRTPQERKLTQHQTGARAQENSMLILEFFVLLYLSDLRF